MGGVFLADTFSAYEVAVAVFYSVVILAAASYLQRTPLLWLCASCVALTLFSLLLSTQGSWRTGLLNTLISLTAIAATTWLALKRAAAEMDAQRAQTHLLRLARIQTLEGLTTTIAHELSQPLTAIVSSAEAGQRWLAQQPPQHARARETLQRILDAGGQASGILGRVRSLSQAAAPARQPFDLNAATQEVLHLAAAQLAHWHIQLVTHWDTDLPPVFADKIQVQQVVSNLLLNAIEAMQGEGARLPRCLHVVSAQQGDSAVLSIQDNGAGFAPALAEQLFAAFWTTKAQGLGLGLGISRMLVEAQGGQISAHNVPEGGARFCFSLPLAHQKESHDAGHGLPG